MSALVSTLCTRSLSDHETVCAPPRAHPAPTRSGVGLFGGATAGTKICPNSLTSRCKRRNVFPPGALVRSWAHSPCPKIPGHQLFGRVLTRGANLTPAVLPRPVPAPSTLAGLSSTDRRLLGLLGEHGVLTTGQLVRLTELPERTVQHRLGRLHRAGLVSRFRPEVPVGTAPGWVRPSHLA